MNCKVCNTQLENTDMRYYKYCPKCKKYVEA